MYIFPLLGRNFLIEAKTIKVLSEPVVDRPRLYVFRIYQTAVAVCGDGGGGGEGGDGRVFMYVCVCVCSARERERVEPIVLV